MGGAKNHAESLTARGFNDTSEAICTVHIADDHLLDLVAHDVASGLCAFCDTPREETVGLEVVVSNVVRAIERSYDRTEVPSDWVPSLDTSDVLWDEFGDVFEPETQLFILGCLNELITVDNWEPLGWERQDGSTYADWRTFRKLVTHRSRFIFVANKDRHTPEGAEEASRFVAEFQRIIMENSEEIIREIPRQTVIYRGRMVSSLDDAQSLANAAALGPAPDDRAAANRMSPAGISLFYGSATQEAAVAEIAAHDVEQRDFALVGAFETLRRFRVLDLTNLQVPSVFDESRYARRGDLGFLKGFVADITSPIKLDGREHREYAPTQVLTELIRWSRYPSVDGIALPSAQARNLAVDNTANYVMFFGPESIEGHGSLRDGSRPSFRLPAGSIEAYKVNRRVDAERAQWRSSTR
ncbi:RES family NAD+ phosphorylase [Cellulomonas sp. Y8]|uniref:RES family NAD+ phosphorylase n=1 Tax=Cellulomonas sp. Y8 TaxID=2591145 RepID=UPI003D757721